jgi:hypothetical protein
MPKPVFRVSSDVFGLLLLRRNNLVPLSSAEAPLVVSARLPSARFDLLRAFVQQV